MLANTARIKKIAIVIDTLNGGGAEKVCMTLSSAMIKRGINAHLIVLKKKCDYDLPADMPVHFLFDDPKTKLYRHATQLEAAKRLLACVAKLGFFDAYFSNLDACHPIVAKANLPNSFYVLHNSVENILKRTSKLGPIKTLRKHKAFAVLNNKHLVAVSEGVKKEILKGNIIKPQSIATIYNPLDLPYLATLAERDDQKIPPQDYIIYVGRFAEQKRLDILLAAYSAMQSQVELVLLGSESKKINKLVARVNFKKTGSYLPLYSKPVSMD